jgi:hypothetical protein
MLQLGKNITIPKDQLIRIELQKVYELLTDKHGKLRQMIEQLRTLYSIDPAKYRRQKTMLPYITCGRFNPPFRHSQNFAAIECFIIDIDHMEGGNLDLQSLKEKLASDERVMMLFASPGGNGLKVLFGLSEKCTDKGKFSLFYKNFVGQLATQYHLHQHIDSRTSDVTRACFLSYDSDTYMNPEALKIDLSASIAFDSPTQVKEINQQIKLFESQLPKPIKEENGPASDQLVEIKKKLNPSYKSKAEKLIYVPEKLDQIIGNITNQIEECGIKVSEIININYGKQFQCELQNRKGEINLFYGKKGFSVVKSSKSGIDRELTDVIHQIVCQYLFP